MSDIIEKIPAFLRELLQKEYGGEAERIFAGYQTRRPVTLRVNTLKADGEEIASALCGMGIMFERWAEDAFILREAQKETLEGSELYLSGKIYLQSLSSMLPPLALRPRAGEQILDMTAAPGGKTTQMFALSGGRALITACEKDGIRFERMKFNLARQGAERVSALHADAEKLDPFLRFDKILLDAPCSGSGTFLADGRGKIGEALLRNCIRTQRRLLKKGISLLKKGGELVYSTCSVLKEENEEAISSVLGSGVRLLPLPEELMRGLPLLKGMENTLTVCPDGLFEGFFVAKLKKE